MLRIKAPFHRDQRAMRAGNGGCLTDRGEEHQAWPPGLIQSLPSRRTALYMQNKQPRMGMTSAFTRCCLNHSLQPAQAWKREQRGQRRSADHLVIFINTGDVHVNIFVGVSAYHVRACLSCCRRFFKQGSIFQPIGELRQKNAPSGRHGLIQCTNRGFVSIQQDSLQLCRGPVGLN